MATLITRKIVIIGGVAAGASAAAAARRTDEFAEITVFERGPFVSFANCGLPYYISGDIDDREDLLLHSPESFNSRFNIAVKTEHEVTAINVKEKNITVINHATKEELTKEYDKLIIATGAKAVVPAIPGIEAKNIFTLKTVPDADALKKFLDENPCKNAVVAGAGFIGLETAEGLVKRGLNTTIVDQLSQVLPPLDPEMAAYVAEHIKTAGAALILGEAIKAFHGAPLATEIELAGGRRVKTDIVVLSVGVSPETDLARTAGLKIGETGGIAVDDYLQTSDPDIYAAGDAVECTQLVSGKKSIIRLAGPANKQGRAAGINAAGGHMRFKGALSTVIVGVMGINAGRTGLSEREAEKEKLDYLVAKLHSGDHAGYYPGSELMHLKVLAERGTGRILGAQAVGGRGIDKRLDVLAAAIYGRMTAADLATLDLAYAPQFSSAKDPVIVAGMILENMCAGRSDGISFQAVEKAREKNPELVLLDVRTPAEYNSGTVDGAKNIPVDELRARLEELDKNAETVVFCRMGLRGYLAERILKQNGFSKVKNLSGGMLSVKPGVSEKAVKKIISVAVQEAMTAKNNGAACIDVRERDEFAYEHIEGTQNIPLSELETASAAFLKHAPVYVFCQSGIRAETGAELLFSKGFADVRVVEGGLAAWKGHGLAYVKSKGPLPIMRQVLITAGSMIIIAVLSVKFFWLAGFIGAGLVFAGITGYCGMAKILAFMPWNKKSPDWKKNTGCGGDACGV